jgi:Domain of unknown function (DUF4129)
MRLNRSLQINPWRELLVFSILLMEVSWVTPWLRSLTATTYGVGSFRVFVGLTITVLFTYLLMRIMDHLSLKKAVRQWIMAVFIFIGIFVGLKTLLYPHVTQSFFEIINRPLRSFTDVRSFLPPEFIVILAILVAFWRGISLSQAYIGPTSVMDHFWLGIIMYVLFIFVNTLFTGETPGDFFYLYLFCSLIAMCTSRINVLGMLRGGSENQFNRTWFGGIILAASLVVILAALLGNLLGTRFGWFGNLLLGIFSLIIILVLFVLSPVISLLTNILGKLFNFQGFNKLGESLQNLNKLIQGLSKYFTNLINLKTIANLFEQWGPSLRAILYISIIIIVILGLVTWISYQLWQDRTRRRLAGEQKSNLKAEDLYKQLRELLRQRWNGIKNSLFGLADFDRRRRLRVAARIRQVYADLMELCDALGHPRNEADTPLEFLRDLYQLFPTLKLEAGMITEAYNKVRYGQFPETHQEVEQIEAAWRKLANAGRELSATQKKYKKK